VIDRGEGRVFPAGCVLLDCPGKTVLTDFRNWFDRFDSLWAFEKNFGHTSISLVMVPVQVWVVFELVLLSFGLVSLLGVLPGQNRPDGFDTPV
jgi:hypothetical protein